MIEQPAPVAEPRKQEPVAWIVWGDKNVPSLTFTKPADKYVFDALYTSPPTLSLARRKPLTDMQVDGEWILVRDLDTNDVEKSRLFARAIEAAHGIYAPAELKENT